MNNDNYKFILADDHKGNKLLAVVKGELSTELVNNARTIGDQHFINILADQLKKIIDSASVIEKDGEHSCN